jgi:serpin B
MSKKSIFLNFMMEAQMRPKKSLLKIQTLTLMLITAFFFTACKQGGEDPATILEVEVVRSSQARDTAPTYTDAEMGELVRSNNTFAFRLYQTLRDAMDEDENIMFSPYSISMAMAMAYAGAENNTETEMAGALSITLPEDRLHPTFNALDLLINSRGEGAVEDEGDPFVLKNVNAAWGQKDYPFVDAYLDLLAVNYDAGMLTLDFITDPEAARKTINNWVLEQTEDRIEDLLPPGSIDDMTRFVLTNAIYFKASWAKPFDVENTRNRDFHLIDGSTVSVPMMWMDGLSGEHGEPFRAAEGQGYQAVEFPYVGGEIAMLLVVPDRGYFRTFEQSLDYGVIEDIVSRLSDVRLDLTMPKFEYGCEFSLVDSLSQLGMNQAFIPDIADFTGIDDGYGGLYISDILHKTFISVDEEGTEAAAATGVVWGAVSIIHPKTIVIDRPFIYMIRDVQTKAVLFVGRVTDPAA